MAKLDSILKSSDITFSSSYIQMWELDHKEVWAPKNWCFQTVVLEKTLERLLDCKDIKPVSLKGHQPWISLEELMLKLKIQYFGHLMQRANSMEKTPLTGKNPDAGKDWGEEEEGTTEEEMIGWHHWLDGHEFEQAPGVGVGQGSLACYSPWGCWRVGHDWATELKWSITN